MAILVTKPGLSGEHLCEAIEKIGEEAIHFPTIAFSSLTNQVSFQANLLNLPQQDWLIFISPTAVNLSLPTIIAHYPHFPSLPLQLAAIGESTANLLKQTVNVPILYPETWNSESLLRLSPFLKPVQKKIMLVKGEGGHPLLKNQLIERGAIVSELLTYKRILPLIDHNKPLSALKLRKINAIIATSGEGVINLKTLIGQKNWPLLQSIPLIVISDRIKLLANDLGFQTIWVASEDISILNLLTKIRMQI